MSLHVGLRITWDEHKRLANLLKHGFDFADLSVAFFDRSVIRAAKNRRLVAIGQLDDGTLAVVFARLGSQGISVISMRTASRKERALQL